MLLDRGLVQVRVVAIWEVWERDENVSDRCRTQDIEDTTILLTMPDSAAAASACSSSADWMYGDEKGTS